MTHTPPTPENWAPPATVAPLIPARRRHRHRWVIAGIIAAVVVAFIVYTNGGSSSGDFTVTGTMQLFDGGDGILASGNTCQGTGGYSDLRPGAQVTITDQSGKTVAASTLGAGISVGRGSCEFDFAVSVPSGEKFYGVTVTHRGTLQYTEAQMRGGIHATIGSGG